MSKRHRDSEGDEASESSASVAEVEKPVHTLAEADKKIETLGRVKPEDVDGVDNRGEQKTLSNVSHDAIAANAGTPTAELRKDLPRTGNTPGLGETQPGVLPPGEGERAVDAEKAKELKEQKENAEPNENESVIVRNGMIHVGDRASIPTGAATVTYERKTAKKAKKDEDAPKEVLVATITHAGGSIEVEGAGAESLQRALKRM